MTEAAAVVAECRVVLDFGRAPVTYAVKVFEELKGGGSTRYFAVGTNDDADDHYRPVGSGDTAETALEDCLARAGIHLRRLVKQADES